MNSSTRGTTNPKTMPQRNEPVPVGRIAGLFGIRGELKCDPTQSGRSLFKPDARFDAALADGGLEHLCLTSVREHQSRLLVRFEGVDTADQAQRYVGSTLLAARERIELEAGEYLDRDLVGCELVDATGKRLGLVEAVEHYPSSDMLVVGGKFVPMIGAFIKSIDLAERRIVADLPAGLLD